MTYSMIYEVAFARSVRGLRERDPSAMNNVVSVVRALAREPRPPEAVRLGTTDLYRLRVGDFRVLYEIREHTVSVLVLHLGQVT
ncbi:type II toxin-antitoxin system RelE/ParE family toxin [Streptomyces sp. 21So2-11]|uniref:type II toxin-antitoxin system RelE family toxin n=1 Tax=Streptomyces sp. 21So2-11 TaxID=3144408 RepID=UPI00321AEA90